MGLGYLTLSIKSEQDQYLIGNPQFTFFKSVYKKHTNFATDFQFVNLIGDSSNTLGKKVYIEIPKNGDLLHRSYLVIDIAGNDNLTKVVPMAYSLIDYIDLYIGGQRIDRHYGHWLQIYHELNESSEKQNALSDMISIQSSKSNKNKLFIPLRYWFNNNVGLALPLLALQYNDIKLEIKFKAAEDVNIYSQHKNIGGLADTLHQDAAFTIKNVQLLCEYIHLDSEERRLFMSNSHEYLITQLQTSLNNPVHLHSSSSSELFEKIQHKTYLRFNHPVKELIWTFQDSNGFLLNAEGIPYNYYNKGILSSNYWNGLYVGKDQMIGAQLVLNGKEMTEELPASFYRNIQQYQYHTGCKLKSIRDYNTANRIHSNYTNYTNGTGVYSYSFCMSPEDYQPSGSLNFSNLEMAQLKYRLQRPMNLTTTVHLADDIDADTVILPPYENSPEHMTSIITIDSIATDIDDIILIRNQLDKTHNGIYKVVAGSVDSNNQILERLPGYATATDLINNTPVYITVTGESSAREGTVNKGKQFIMTYNSSTQEIHVSEYNEAIFTLQHKTLTIYAVNYNVFRIMSGMGSLLFSS
jgi:hypothetical protein